MREVSLEASCILFIYLGVRVSSAHVSSGEGRIPSSPPKKNFFFCSNMEKNIKFLGHTKLPWEDTERGGAGRGEERRRRRRREKVDFVSLSFSYSPSIQREQPFSPLMRNLSLLPFPNCRGPKAKSGPPKGPVQSVAPFGPRDAVRKWFMQSSPPPSHFPPLPLLSLTTVLNFL